MKGELSFYRAYMGKEKHKMKCKIYVKDVHMLTVDNQDVYSIMKWLKDTGHTNIRLEGE